MSEILYSIVSTTSDPQGLYAIGAGLALIAGFGVGIGQGIAAGLACLAIGRNPEADKKIRITMLIGIALTETAAIYSFVTALILISKLS